MWPPPVSSSPSAGCQPVNKPSTAMFPADYFPISPFPPFTHSHFHTFPHSPVHPPRNVLGPALDLFTGGEVFQGHTALGAFVLT